MKFSLLSVAVCLLGLTSSSLAAATASNSLTVHITDSSDYCFILPKKKESIGDAERPGGLKSFCTKPVSGQGSLPSDMFYKGPYIKTGKGHGSYKQITGCFRPSKVATVQPHDGGGQVDSNGGSGGKGNPANSACAGYSGYVSLIEPDNHRICLRCCKDLRDCDVSNDTAGCPKVIPGTYGC